MCIPDEPHHIAAFRGAMQTLGSAYNWADDDAHTAKDVAKLWREIIDQGDSCLEFRQDTCHLYMVANGIETLIYNGQECINANIADGTLARANSGPVGDIPLQQCAVYTLKLTPGASWSAPTVVNTGDTILLSNWQGGSTDWGTASTVWTCPSGGAYIFGACGDVRPTTIFGTDPLQTAPHLSVIAKIGDVYYDVWNSNDGKTPAEFTVPSGVLNQPLRLLMNVGDIVAYTATGEIWGDVTICNHHQWCHKWMGGSGIQSAIAAFGSYDAVNDKIVGTPYSAGFAGEWQLVLPSGSYTVTAIEENVTVGANPASNGCEIRRISPYTPYVNRPLNNQTATVSVSGLSVQPGWTINCGAVVGPAGQPGPATVNWVKFYGTGTTNPFGGNNC